MRKYTKKISTVSKSAQDRKCNANELTENRLK